jgi:hypothetical protein
MEMLVLRDLAVVLGHSAGDYTPLPSVVMH